MGFLSKIITASVVIIISGASALIFHMIRKIIRNFENPTLRKAVDAFNYLDIIVVTTVEDCDHVVNELRKRSMKHKALGFDCEWVTGSLGRQPVALLQLSSFDGYCGLFRLNCFPHNTIPDSLRDLLQCEDIYKVGVAPNGDTNYIRSDYQMEVRATIDIRYIVEVCGYQESAGGLGAMTERLLNVSLDKRWRTRCSNWEAVELSPLQLHYAASDAHAAILIFVTVLNNRSKCSFPYLWWSRDPSDVWETVDEICWQYSDRNYKAKKNGRDEGSKRDKKGKEPKRFYRAHATRTKPLYHNCLLQAPDGELLCTCDIKKALWYVEKGLADQVNDEPITVRLRFEPVTRSTGDVGEYYKTTKGNHCVVCSATNSYIRKNIVPREYRKHFPEIMKDHSSHDVLLLCVSCHQRSNIQDQVKRRHLAVTCDAPLAHENPKVFEDAAIKKVRMAARALLFHGRKHALPTERRRQLEATVLAQFPELDAITDSLLEEAASMQHTVTNEDFTVESHGFRVVSKYLESEGGLLKLEEEWRSQFLTSMKPKFMPELWSIHHNRDRLKVKWDDKRLDTNDLKSIGVKW